MTPINRRAALRLAVPTTLTIAGVGPAAASLDGKGNDVCPCFFGIDKAILAGDGTIAVSGHCAVANPPEEVTVHVRIRGERGARALGSSTFECEGSEGDEDEFSVTAPIRGTNRFECGDDVHVDATAHINPDDEPAIGAGKWTWDGGLE